MPDKGVMKEVWATVLNRYQRVYRGREQEHADWKMNEYRRNGAELFFIGINAAGEEVRVAAPKKN